MNNNTILLDYKLNAAFWDSFIVYLLSIGNIIYPLILTYDMYVESFFLP